MGYAVGKSAGNAVARNRIRRRLRAAVARAVEPEWVDGTYVVAAGPEAADMPFADLEAVLGVAFKELHERALAAR